MSQIYKRTSSEVSVLSNNMNNALMSLKKIYDFHFNSVYKKPVYLCYSFLSAQLSSHAWHPHTHSWHSVEILSSLVLPRKTRTRALKFPVLGLFATLKKKRKQSWSAATSCQSQNCLFKWVCRKTALQSTNG